MRPKRKGARMLRTKLTQPELVARHAIGLRIRRMMPWLVTNCERLGSLVGVSGRAMSAFVYGDASRISEAKIAQLGPLLGDDELSRLITILSKASSLRPNGLAVDHEDCTSPFVVIVEGYRRIEDIAMSELSGLIGMSKEWYGQALRCQLKRPDKAARRRFRDCAAELGVLEECDKRSQRRTRARIARAIKSGRMETRQRAGALVRLARVNLHHRISDLARLSGFSVTSISRLENGSQADCFTIACVCEALGIEADQSRAIQRRFDGKEM